MHQQRRPGILTFLALMQFAGGAVSLAFGLLISLFLGAVAFSGVGGNVLLGLVLVSRGIVQLPCAIGLWTVQRYGRVLALALSWLSLVATGVQLLIGPIPFLWTSSIGFPMTPVMVSLNGLNIRGIPDPLPLLTLVYLHMPGIAALFAGRGKSDDRAAPS